MAGEAAQGQARLGALGEQSLDPRQGLLVAPLVTAALEHHEIGHLASDRRKAGGGVGSGDDGGSGNGGTIGGSRLDAGMPVEYVEPAQHVSRTALEIVRPDHGEVEPHVFDDLRPARMACQREQAGGARAARRQPHRRDEALDKRVVAPHERHARQLDPVAARLEPRAGSAHQAAQLASGKLEKKPAQPAEEEGLAAIRTRELGIPLHEDAAPDKLLQRVARVGAPGYGVAQVGVESVGERRLHQKAHDVGRQGIDDRRGEEVLERGARVDDHGGARERRAAVAGGGQGHAEHAGVADRAGADVVNELRGQLHAGSADHPLRNPRRLVRVECEAAGARRQMPDTSRKSHDSIARLEPTSITCMQGGR